MTEDDLKAPAPSRGSTTAGELSPDTPVFYLDRRNGRKNGFAAFWAKYAGSIAFALLIFLGVVGFARVEAIAEDAKQASEDVEQFTADLREANVEGCERQNVVRAAVVQQLQREVDQEIPPEFFPDIPPDVFEQLVTEEKAQTKKTIKALAPADCEAAYPKEG